MRWATAVLVVGMFGAGAGFAQTASAPATAATQATQPAQQRVVRMTVQPAGEPVPALKYRLLPPLEDQIHGDAMTLYYTAMERVALRREKQKGFDDQADKWLETPLADLPMDRVRAMLKEFDEALPLLDLATRQTRCEWNLGVEQLGFATFLPGLSTWRYMNRFTTLQARRAIAEGRYEDALHSLQIGFGMAWHVAGGPTLIQTLVGISIAEKQIPQMESLIAAEGSPNLYWAIATLPKPLCDLSGGLHYERYCLYFSVPELREARAGRLSPQQWEAMPELIAKRLGPALAEQEPKDVPNIAKGIVPKTVLPAAREYWHSQGLSDKQIDAMPVNEVNIVYSLVLYDRLGQDTEKWFHLPYWQARAGLSRASKQTQEVFKTEKGLFSFFEANYSKIHGYQTVLQQHLAALQTIEAIRIHAATHEERVPATLAEMTDLPAPINPVTGQAFQYETMGNTFVLDAPVPEGFDVDKGVRYEVTVTAK
jgi:hypothetical protein